MGTSKYITVDPAARSFEPRFLKVISFKDYDGGLPLKDVQYSGIQMTESHNSVSALVIFDKANPMMHDRKQRPTIKAYFKSDTGAVFWDQTITLARRHAGEKPGTLDNE